MIRRPNVRARCYRSNLQTKSYLNRYGHRVTGRYYRRCRWCGRPEIMSLFIWPRLCATCGWYLREFEPEIMRNPSAFWNGR